MRKTRPYLDKTNPDIYKSLAKAVGHNRRAAKAANVPPGLLELVNIRASQLNACPTCLSVHVPAALKAGVEKFKIDVLPSWRDTTIYSDVERAALEISESLTLLDPKLDRNELATELGEVLTTEQIAVLEWTTILINSFNRISIASGHPVNKY